MVQQDEYQQEQRRQQKGNDIQQDQYSEERRRQQIGYDLQQDQYSEEQRRQQKGYYLQQGQYSEEQRRQQQEYNLQEEQYSEEQRRHQQEYNLQQEQHTEEQRRHQQEYNLQEEQYSEEQRRQQQQMDMQQEQNSPTTDDQSPDKIHVSKEREAETESHEDDCVMAETFSPLEPEVEKQTSSANKNVPTSSHVEFREPEKLVDLDVSVESSPDVSKGLSIDPLTGLPEGWHRTKHERPKGSPYFQLKPAGSKMLRSQIEVNSYLQQKGIKMKIYLNGPVTRQSPKKKINLKKRLPILPSSSEELEEKGEEPVLEDKSEEKTPTSSVERGTDDEERELKELVEERDNIYKIPPSERTSAQNTRIYTLLKKIKKLKNKFPDIKVLKRGKKKKAADTNIKELPLSASKVIEQADNESTKEEAHHSELMKAGQEEDMSKKTKRKKKKKKVPITPSEVVEDDEDKINDPV